RVVRNLAAPADASGPALWVWPERRSRVPTGSAPWRHRLGAVWHAPTAATGARQSTPERFAPSPPAAAEPAAPLPPRPGAGPAAGPPPVPMLPGWTRREPATARQLPRLGLRIAG